jgi:hypothetical protein
MKQGWKINLLIAAVAAALWVISYAVNSWTMAIGNHVPGIALVFIPAGIRLLVLLVGGFWAAAGTAIGAFICAGFELGGIGLPLSLAVSLVAGFGPYLALLVTCRFYGIKPSLDNLRPVHLPVIALSSAVFSALLHNVLFAMAGLTEWRDFVAHTAAMTTGDFAGSLLIVVLALGVLWSWRKVARKSGAFQ